jgi:hypothetical protein
VVNSHEPAITESLTSFQFRILRQTENVLEKTPLAMTKFLSNHQWQIVYYLSKLNKSRCHSEGAMSLNLTLVAPSCHLLHVAMVFKCCAVSLVTGWGLFVLVGTTTSTGEIKRLQRNRSGTGKELFISSLFSIFQFSC